MSPRASAGSAPERQRSPDGSGRATGRRRVGRPPRIDRDAIADAVLEIGLEQCSMKSVAAHLGVSVPGLYHHVANRKELLLLAAERSMASLPLPEDRGQHWSEWLREWARYSRSSFVDDPEILTQFLSGALSVERMVDVIDSVIQVLTGQGFEPHEAMEAWDAVGRCALGAAVEAIRQHAGAEAGRPLVPEVHRLLAERPPEDLPGVRAVFAGYDKDLIAEFEEDLTTLLVGIAVRRGEPWEPVVATVAQ